MRLAAKIATLAASALLVAAGTANAAAPVIDEYPLAPINSQPIGVAAGPDGAVWFTQSNANRIGRVTTSGTVTTYTVPTAGSTPWAIAPGPDGRLWFTEHNGDRIGAITTGGTITEYPLATGAAPVDLVAGPDGAVWFTEGDAGKIGRITTTGAVTEFGTGSASSSPRSIDVGPDGALWFAELGSNKIGRITTSGGLTEYPIPTSSSQPSGIATGGDGAIWFTEIAGNKIGRITTAGSITEYTVPTSTVQPLAITAGPDGNLWFTEQIGNKVGRITPAGAVTEFAVPNPSPTLEGITVGPDGRLWFAELQSNKIGALAIPPAATTGAASAVDAAGATLGADVAGNGPAVSYHFEYGTTSLYGQSTGTQTAPGSGTQAVSAAVTGLAPSTTYHFRVVATTAGGTVNGGDATFTTPATPTGDGGSTTPPPDGGSTGPGAGTDPSDPTAALAAKLVLPKRVTVSRSGKVPVTVDCPKAAANGCHGSITIAFAPKAATGIHSTRKAVLSSERCGRGCRRLGRKRYKVAGGARKVVRTKLNAAGRRVVRRRGSVRVRITMRTVAQGRSSVKRRTVVLRRRAPHTTHPSAKTGVAPEVTTKDASNVTATGAKLAGLVKPSGESATAWFEYGTTTEYGSLTPTSASGNSQVSVSATLDSLEPGTTYHFRLVASSDSGTAYGADMEFTTLVPAPAAAAPVLGEQVVVRPGTGSVAIKPAGAERFQSLDGATAIPTGSTIDARRGTVKLTSVRDDTGAPQTAAFRGGVFRVRQRASGMTDLYLRGGNLRRACSRYAQAKATLAGVAQPKRRLWGRDRGGRFRTHGSNAIATVRGTEWTVVDRCDGTLTRVGHGKVAVRDLTKKRTVLVRAGGRYLARAGR